MKFSEMTYTRPDINALLARCKQLAAKAADAQDGDALIQVYYEQSRAFADVFREPQGKAHHTVSHTHPQKEHTQRHQGEQPQKKILPFTASKVASSRNGMHLFNLI